MMHDFGAPAQGDPDHSKIADTPDNNPTDPRTLRPVADLLDLLNQITGVEVTPDTSNTRAPLTERFVEFHAGNPGVYAALRTLAYQKLRAGRKRLSIGNMYERLRELSIETNGNPWLLDNSYKPFFARLLMAEEPALRGRFEVRSSVADAWIRARAAQTGADDTHTGQRAA